MIWGGKGRKECNSLKRIKNGDRSFVAGMGWLESDMLGLLGNRAFFVELLSKERYGVATISRLHKIIGFFCRISSVL